MNEKVKELKIWNRNWDSSSNMKYTFAAILIPQNASNLHLDLCSLLTQGLKNIMKVKIIEH